jgi:hypothetical protein
MIATVHPLYRMVDHACADHVQVDVHKTVMQVLVGSDGGTMIMVFPKRSLPRFSLVVFLGSAAGDLINCRLWAMTFGPVSLILKTAVSMMRIG